VAFSFLGIETITVTAFEARFSKSLRRPSQVMAYVAFLLYFLCALGEVLNVKWNNNHLPAIYGGIGNNTVPQSTEDPQSTSMLVIAAWEAGYKDLAGFLNGCLIFSVLSASNTSLYVASRTLYGLTREADKHKLRAIHVMSTVVPKTGAPAAAVVVSALSFFWLPFLQLKGGYTIQRVSVSKLEISCQLTRRS